MKKKDLANQLRVSELLAAGEKFFSGGRYAEAIGECRKAAALDKNAPGAADLIVRAENIIACIANLRERAAEFRHKGERLRAAMLYTELLKLDPGLSDVSLELEKLNGELNAICTLIEAGEKLFSLQEYGAAVAKWKEVFKLDKNNQEADFLINKAKEVFARKDGLLAKAHDYRRQGEPDPAARTYEELLRIFPNLADARKELAEVNAEIRRSNVLRVIRHQSEKTVSGGNEKTETGALRSSAGRILSAATVAEPRAWKNYLFAALIFAIFALLFKLLPLLFLSASSSPLFVTSAVLVVVLLSLLAFFLYTLAA
ncbi:MAG: tetratricopeptide repeat protein [Elusimicrobia bacterium]|nr:tetratricopeptide repeat protein [Elusimicrobiota bacterium]